MIDHFFIQRWSTLLQRHPGTWPRLAYYALCLLLFVMPLLIGWQIYLEDVLATHQRMAQEEQQQKEHYLQKLQQASSLPQWQTRKDILRQRIRQHQQQLLDHGDDHLLLGEIATLADRNQLMLVHARPASTITQTHYLVLPLQISLRGSYHDIGRFTAALAAAKRPLFLGDLQLSAEAKDRDQLRLDATVCVYHLPRPASPP